MISYREWHIGELVDNIYNENNELGKLVKDLVDHIMKLIKHNTPVAQYVPSAMRREWHKLANVNISPAIVESLGDLSKQLQLLEADDVLRTSIANAVNDFIGNVTKWFNSPQNKQAQQAPPTAPQAAASQAGAPSATQQVDAASTPQDVTGKQPPKAGKVEPESTDDRLGLGNYGDNEDPELTSIFGSGAETGKEPTNEPKRPELEPEQPEQELLSPKVKEELINAAGNAHEIIDREFRKALQTGASRTRVAYEIAKLGVRNRELLEVLKMKGWSKLFQRVKERMIRDKVTNREKYQQWKASGKPVQQAAPTPAAVSATGGRKKKPKPEEKSEEKPDLSWLDKL